MTHVLTWRDKLSAPSTSSRQALVVVAVLGAAVFALDSFSPLWTPDWSLYFLPVLFASPLRTGRHILAVAAMCTVLMWLGLLWSPEGGVPLRAAAFDRGVGTVVLWIATALVVQRRQVQSVLTASELRYRSLFETATDGIAILDAHSGTITAVNPFLEELLGHTHAELLGHHLLEISAFKDAAATQQALQECRQREHFRCEHLQFERQDGRCVDVELVSNVYWLGGEKVIQLNFRDITARKQLERHRTEYLAMLTHDIRNPLAVIYGYVDILKQLSLPQEAQQLVAAIGSSARSVVGLITDYLDLTTIELSELNLHKGPVALSSLVAQVALPYQPEAARRGINLAIRCDGQLPTVAGDSRALERIFANLLHNAFKFTPDGGQIAVSASHSGGRVNVAVVNSGPGIAPDELPLLFQRYQRTETGRTRHGMGLGLFIVKSLVEAQGGTVDVNSTPGRETRFTVLLPIHGSASAAPSS